MAHTAEHSEPFSPRSHPHLFEINTWTWLEQLSQEYGRPLSLGEVPDAAWDEFRRLGFDLIWLMGVWERSPESRRIFQTDADATAGFDQALPGWTQADIVGSPYAVRLYGPDPRIGTWGDIDRVREKLHARGMGLLLDFVSNHTALDHPWVREHPEYYIQGSEADFRRDPGAFFPMDAGRSTRVFIARARDPYFPPWKDVAQVNYFEPAAGAAMRGILRELSKHCDGVRCDMAMLVLNDVFAKTWGAFLGARRPPAEEFWTDAIAAVPEFIWLAEVYWGMERRLQDLGFSFTYDKALYDKLRAGQPLEIRQQLTAEFDFQRRLARFLENHDEARSAAVFGPARLQAVGTLLATLPGCVSSIKANSREGRFICRLHWRELRKSRSIRKRASFIGAFCSWQTRRSFIPASGNCWWCSQPVMPPRKT